MGINVKQMKSILTYKLMMDDRRPISLQAARQNTAKQGELKNSTIWAMFMYFMMGALYLFMFQFGVDYVTKFSIYFTMFMVFLGMALISDFTAVLIDVRDTYIILPKPVSDATFVTARLLHIFIYIGKLVFPMSLPCFIYLAIQEHLWASFVFLLVLIFLVLFTIFVINAIYIVILRVTTPERFKNVISYFQIAFAIAIYAGYQILPRMMDGTEGFQLSLDTKPWLLFFPPFWFANAYNGLVNFQVLSGELIPFVLAFAAPVLSIFVVAKYLAPAFNQKLAMISGSEAATEIRKDKTTQANSGVIDRLSSWLTGSQVEKMGFLFAWKMMWRSRDFKLRTYPSIGYMLVLVAMMFIRNSDGPRNLDKALFMPIIALYFSSILLITVISQLAYSEKFKASWVFWASPLERPGLVLLGAVKAAMLQFNAFIVVIVLLLSGYLFGLAALPNVLLAACNQVAICLGLVLVGAKYIPFSVSISEAQKGTQVMRVFLVFIMAALIGFLHYFLFKNPIAIAIGFVVSLSLSVLFLHLIKKISWNEILAAEF
jgi:hypothetical protein